MGVPEAPDTKVKMPRPVTERRRIRKPIMEKKRRDRINTCLDELSSLLQEERMVKARSGKASKLEKADVLELTVRYWQSFMATKTRGAAEDSADESGYMKGYKHCISLVDSLLGDFKEPGTDSLREGLLEHLSEKVEMMRPPQSHEDKNESNKPPSEDIPREDGHSLALIPTLLPDGALALLLQEGVGNPLFNVAQTKEGNPNPANEEASVSSTQSNDTPKLTKESEGSSLEQYKALGTILGNQDTPMEEDPTTDRIPQAFDSSMDTSSDHDHMWRPW